MFFKTKKNNSLILITFISMVFFVAKLFAQDIVFLLPKSLKVTTNTVTVKGTVMDFDITEIDLAVVNLTDLVKEQEQKKSSKKEKKKESWLSTLEYETIPVTNSFFQTVIKIQEGINVIIGKPVEVKATPKNTEMKVIVLDKTSPDIELIEPVTDQIVKLKQISGKLKRKISSKTVKITVDALLSMDTDGEKNYKMNRLLDVIVPLKGNKFSLPVSLTEMLTGNEIVILTISIDGTEITKTLF